MSTPVGLPDIFADTPIDLVPSQVIAEFPANTFLESIAVAPDGTLFITNHFEGKVIRIGQDKVPTVYAVVAGKATGLAFLSEHELLLTGWDEQGVSTIFKISLQGAVETLLSVPDAIFLNGLTKLTENRYLIADSYRGAIWEFNAVEARIDIWLENSLLARTSTDQERPAVNGLKIFDNVLYASNTEKQHIVQIPIVARDQPGEPTMFINSVNTDDFAFDLNGNLQRFALERSTPWA